MKAGKFKGTSVLLRGKYTFNTGKSSSNTDEHMRPWLCCPFQALSVLMQVKLETPSTGISAVCQLAVNIYCFSCCDTSS